MCFPFVLAIGFIHEYLFVIFIVNTLTGAPGPAHKYLDIGLVSLSSSHCMLELMIIIHSDMSYHVIIVSMLTQGK